MIRYYLNVPFSEKDSAKKLGARWDSNNKHWFIVSNHPNLEIIRENWDTVYTYDDGKKDIVANNAAPKPIRTIEEIKSMDMHVAILIISKMKPSVDRDQLDEWIFDTHYRKLNLFGPLTNRIRNFNNKICYREIMRRCFNGTDIISLKQTRTILSQKTIEFIKELHTIQASLTGIFLDYLFRRIISEQLGRCFEDTRAFRYLETARHVCNRPCIQYSTYTITALRNICKINNLTRYSKLNKNELCEFIVSKLPSDPCRTTIQGDDCDCILPICQYLSYEKTCNISEYKTDTIVPEIFLVSLTHSECFGGAPKQDKFDQIYNLLQDTERVRNELVEPLSILCSNLIHDKSNIELNPILGNCFAPPNNNSSNIFWQIPADADLIIDDTIIDLKCTIGNNEVYEILQLLGYASLADTHKKSIRSLQILNLLQGTETTYHTNTYLTENWHSFLHLFIGLQNDDVCNKCMENK